MTELSELESAYENLSPAKRLLFLSACIRHVAGAFSRVAGVPAKLHGDVISPAIIALESGGTSDASTLAKVIVESERIAQDLGENAENDLQSIVLACASAIEIAGGASKSVRSVVNNLDDTITMCDTDEEAGLEEEFELRLRFLAALTESETGGGLPELVGTILDWERRWAADYNQL